MTRRPPHRSLWCSSLLLIVGLFAAGCATQESPALLDLGRARGAIDEAMKCTPPFPVDKIDGLELRHRQARGVYYACQDAEASRLAQGIIADAACARPVAAAPPPPPANRPPVARVSGPNEGEVNTLLNFSGEGSSDPDNDRLTYQWDFGDGTTASFTFPSASHRYARAGNYSVRLMVDDGRGGSDSAAKPIAIIRKVVLQDRVGRVLFDFDKATLKPEGQRLLAGEVQELKENPTLRVDIVGHTDSIGTDAYNMGLSKRRAEAVRNYFASQGIEPNRMSVAWKGESEPIAPNTTAEGRAQNRRVEMTLRPMAVQ
jgi:outer membrane protein OmpA-like peptidoglycan-associated protein